MLKILKAELVAENSPEADLRPSLDVGKQHLRIFCGERASDGVLEILEVQPVGKKSMAVGAFMNGLQNRTINLI